VNYDREGAGYGNTQNQGYGSNTAGSGIGQNQGYGSNTAGSGMGSGRSYDNDRDENDFESAKCGHNNAHLRKNKNRDAEGRKVDEYGNPKPTMMEKLNPKVDSNGDGKAGFMK
jgi:hypothetical protein